MRVRSYRLNDSHGQVSRVAEPFAENLTAEPTRRTLTVSELTRQVKELFE